MRPKKKLLIVCDDEIMLSALKFTAELHRFHVIEYIEKEVDAALVVRTSQNGIIQPSLDRICSLAIPHLYMDKSIPRKLDSANPMLSTAEWLERIRNLSAKKRGPKSVMREREVA